MKKEEIENTIQGHFKKIEKCFQKVVRAFQVEDIHNFRTETKRLRSFLHLLEMEKEEGIHFNTAKKLKTVYGYAGIIRNLQLQLVAIEETLPADKLPHEYMLKLKREMEEWEMKVRAFMDAENNFMDEEVLLLEKAPEKLKKKAIRQFIQFNIFKMKGLLDRLHEDESIHAFRKLMKDLYYNKPYLEHYMASLPSGISERFAAKAAIEMLGRFHDKCVGLALLKTYNDESIGKKDEKEILEQIEQKWEREKQILKERIQVKLDLFHITSEKIKSVTFVDTSYQ